jgi:hypothetical protein
LRGEGDFEKHFQQGYSEQKTIPALTNWGEYPAPVFDGKKCCKTA